MLKKILLCFISGILLVGCTGEDKITYIQPTDEINTPIVEETPVPTEDAIVVEEELNDKASELVDEKDKAVAYTKTELETGSYCEYFIFENKDTKQLYGSFNAKINTENPRKGYQEYMAFASAGEYLVNKFYYLVETYAGEELQYDTYSFEDGEYLVLNTGIEAFNNLTDFTEEEAQESFTIFMNVLDQLLKDETMAKIADTKKMLEIE